MTKEPELKPCYFSTGICETLTCSVDGKFDEFGYQKNKCSKFPCDKYKKLSRSE